MPPTDHAAPARPSGPRSAARRRRIRRRRGLAVVALLAAAGAVALVVVGVAGRERTGRMTGPPRQTGSRPRGARPGARAADRRARDAAAGTYGVGVVTLHLTDPSRTITLPSGQTVPRPLTTIVRYPTARPDGASGQPHRPFPLIVFGHGFDIMPSAYRRLLRYWTTAGFVVAAPIFPRENPAAPGGPNEVDLPNQPEDMREVITALVALSRQPHSPLSGRIDPHEVAVAGHSDGGDTALALAYDPSLRDPHLQAAVILSGAEIPTLPAFTIAPGGPPLLATQGTADVVNLPTATAAFFGPAPPPKYLLQVLHGHHLGPYATNRRQLGVVERVTTAFLQYYLDHDGTALLRMLHAGDVPGLATLQADV